jgi:hypothetical protein
MTALGLLTVKISEDPDTILSIDGGNGASGGAAAGGIFHS